MVVLHARRVLRLPYLLALVGLALVSGPVLASKPTITVGIYSSYAAARDACDAHKAARSYPTGAWAGSCSGFDGMDDSLVDTATYSGQRYEDYTSTHAPDSYEEKRYYFLTPHDGGCPTGTDEQPDGECTQFEAPTEPLANMKGPKGAQEACFDGAEYKSVGVGVSLGDDSEMLSNWEPTGNACSEGQPSMMPNDNPADPGCVTGDSGMQVCDGDPGFNEQCGTFNGEYVCKAALPNGGACMVGEGDTNTCANNGVTAVAPQFDPATEHFEVTSGPETMHMIDNSTGDVTNMTVQQGTVSQGSHGLTDPVPDQAGDGGDGDGEEQGSGICEEAPKLCAEEDGGGPLDVPTWGEEPTIEGSTGGYMDRLAAAPIIAAASGIADHMPAGVCPMIDLSTEYLGPATTNIHCDLYAEHAGTISALFLAMWSLLAVVVVLRA